MKTNHKSLVTPSAEGEYQRYTNRSLCRRHPPQCQRVSENKWGLCYDCRSSFYRKRKLFERLGQTFDIEQFLHDFPLHQSLGLCKRCPEELQRRAYPSTGLCRDCSNSWTNLKARLRRQNPNVVLPTAEEFTRLYPKSMVKCDGKWQRIIPRSPS